MDKGPDQQGNREQHLPPPPGVPIAGIAPEDGGHPETCSHNRVGPRSRRKVRRARHTGERRREQRNGGSGVPSQ